MLQKIVFAASVSAVIAVWPETMPSNSNFSSVPVIYHKIAPALFLSSETIFGAKNTNAVIPLNAPAVNACA